MPDRISALAGVAQAASAVAIGVLTVVLAWIGYAALGAARTEAQAAQEGVAEARRSTAALRDERELSVMPFLSTAASVHMGPTHEFALSLTAYNHSSHPALQVSITLFHGPWDGSPPNDAVNPVLRYSPRTREVIPAGGNKPFDWMLPPSDVGDSVVVALRYSGPLGGTAIQRYELFLHDREERGRDWFVQRERFVQPSAPGANPIVIR